jgi:hypothetical protein
MSWADDNLSYFYSVHVSELWRKGRHMTKSGKGMKLGEMTTYHLKNTINYFRGGNADITPLKEELERRKQNKKLRKGE